jgi:hypothetical protein
MYYIKGKDGICMVGMKSESWSKASGPHGVEIHSEAITHFNPPQLFYPYEWKVGKEWIVNSTATTSTKSEHGGKAQAPTQRSIATASTCRITGIERISLPSGDFESFIVEVTSANIRMQVGDMAMDTGIVTRFWFVPGPGAVKTIQSTHTIGTGPKSSVDLNMTMEMVLKDYHLED